MNETYKIIRFFANRSGSRGLTLAEAQAWCTDHNTSSSTATSKDAIKRTEKYGPWFDGYTKE